MLTRDVNMGFLSVCLSVCHTHTVQLGAVLRWGQGAQAPSFWLPLPPSKKNHKTRKTQQKLDLQNQSFNHNFRKFFFSARQQEQ